MLNIDSSLTNLNVTGTGFVGPAPLSPAPTSLYREQYISVPEVASYLQGGTNPPNGAGMYPDALIL